MFRSATVALLAASAVTAQPELTAENGNLMVRSVSEVDLGNIEAQLATTTFDATVGATERMFTAMTQMNRDNELATARLQSTINAAVGNLNSQLASQSAAMSAAMAANSNAMSTRMSAQTAAVASQMALVTDAISTSQSAMISRSAVAAGATTTALNAMNASLVVALANKASENKHFWLGGCSSHNHGCWQDFCLNRVEIDKARPYFQKRTNTRMRALVAGMFRMNAYFMGTRNWMHVSIFINGRRKRMTYTHRGRGWWRGDYSDQIFYIAAGQDFWFQGCGHFHSASSDYSHQRQEFMWVGKRPA